MTGYQLFIVNQRIFVRGPLPGRYDRLVTPLETRLLASIFGTLLSSQGSDALHCSAQWARLRGQPFKFTRLLLGRQIRDPLLERPDPIALGSRRDPYPSSPGGRLEPPEGGPSEHRALRWSGGSAHGTGLLRESACGAHPVVSVPPSRADVRTLSGGPLGHKSGTAVRAAVSR